MRSYKSNLYVDTIVTIAFYCMYMCMNFVHTVAFYNGRYRYCYLQSVSVAFYCIYMCMNVVHSCVWQLFLKNNRWDEMRTNTPDSSPRERLHELKLIHDCKRLHDSFRVDARLPSAGRSSWQAAAAPRCGVAPHGFRRGQSHRRHCHSRSSSSLSSLVSSGLVLVLSGSRRRRGKELGQHSTDLNEFRPPRNSTSALSILSTTPEKCCRCTLWNAEVQEASWRQRSPDGQRFFDGRRKGRLLRLQWQKGEGCLFLNLFYLHGE